MECASEDRATVECASEDRATVECASEDCATVGWGRLRKEKARGLSPGFFQLKSLGPDGASCGLILEENAFS